MGTQSFLKGLGYPVERSRPGDEAVYGITWLASIAQRQVAKVLKTFGLTPVKFNYLMVVKHIGCSKGLSQREIARRLLVDAGNVTHALDDLERKGWVIRHPGPDRRSHRIRITPKGSRLLDEVWPAHKKAIERLTEGVPEKAHRQLVGILNKWRENLKGGNP